MPGFVKNLSRKASKLALKAQEHKGKIVAGTMAALGTIQAQAALVAPTYDSADAITVGTAVLGGYAAIWGIKRAIGLGK